jgi:hypothetical protein
MSTTVSHNLPPPTNTRINSAVTTEEQQENKAQAQENISEIHQKTNETNASPQKDKNTNFFDKFLKDEWPVRTWFALGNEIAECFKELAAHLLPKPIAGGLYAGLWSLAFFSTGSRIYANSKAANEADKVKAGTKMLVHDGISAIGAPTVVANIMNFIQNRVYKALPIPTTLKHLIRSLVSLTACKFTIKYLDPHAMKLSGDIMNHKEDRHKAINLAQEQAPVNPSKQQQSFAQAA